MNPYKKVYYFTLRDMDSPIPFSKASMKQLLKVIYDQETDSDLVANIQLPPDFLTNEAIYNELFTLLNGRYYDEYIFKIEKWPSEEPSSEEVESAFYNWVYKCVSLLNLTYEYYVPLLTFYRANKSNLMDDITALSRNKIKYNDTPQNANASGVYEGDDYITQFTKTEGESISPLTTKINRLKEIQDGYKNVMADWVKEFEKLFMEAN